MQASVGNHAALGGPAGDAPALPERELADTRTDEARAAGDRGLHRGRQAGSAGARAGMFIEPSS